MSPAQSTYRERLGSQDRAEARRSTSPRSLPCRSATTPPARSFRCWQAPTFPAGWQGGLPLAYHVGPGPAEVEFSITMDYKLRPIWNVIATIPGSVEPDRWIMVGNHRDAWVYGAVDPGSGTAATLEMCRAIGEAAKNGWKPRRTLVYASWDAEEYGLVGSTEWAEEHASTVDQKVALLLNVDSAVSGRELDMGGVPSLRDLALDAAGAINDVRSGRSLRDIWVDAKRTAWTAASPLNLSDPIWDDAAHGSPERWRKTPPAWFHRSDASAGLGLGLHGVSRSSRNPRPRHGLLGRLRRVPLHLRRLHLDGKIRRSRVPDPHDGRPPVHSPAHEGGRGRGAAVALRPLWRGAPRSCRRAAPDPRQADSGQSRCARASGIAIAGLRSRPRMSSRPWSAPCADSSPRRRSWTRLSMLWRAATRFRRRHSGGSTIR